MLFRKQIYVFVTAVILITATIPSQAACTVANMAGTWRFFGVTGSPYFQGFGRGPIVISSTGTLNTAASFLTLSNGQTFRFASGVAKINAACSLTGSVFRLTNGVSISIVDGMLNGSKNVVSAVYRRSDGDVGLINLIK